MLDQNDFYGLQAHQRLDSRAIGYHDSEQEAKDFENRSRNWDG